MLLKSAAVACLLVLAHSATIQQKNIPVEVKYDGAASETGGASKNLDEKVQLSREDLGEALKHLPITEEVFASQVRSELVTPEPDSASIQHVLRKAEDIIYSGLNKLKSSFKAEKDQRAPSSQQWEDFERSVDEYLQREKVKLQAKQGQVTQPPQNVFQNIAQGFQNVADNFIQNLVTTPTSSTTQGDEQQPGQGGPFQGFVSFFQNGVNNVVNSINGLGNQGSTTSNTVLGDTGSGTTTQAPGFVSNIVNNVQQLIGQIQGAAQGGGSSGTQGDTGVNSTSSSSSQGPGQIIQSIGSAINQFIQGRPPNTSGDEGTGTTEANVNIIQSIGNVIQNSPLNPFRPSQKPAEGGATTSNPIQAGISGVQNIGSQVQQLIPGQASSTEGTKIEDQVSVEQASQSAVQSTSPSSEPQPEQPKGLNLDVDKKDEEITKGEEIQQQMEEQVKQEEIKEELKQEEMKEKVQLEENKEMMVTAE